MKEFLTSRKCDLYLWIAITIWVLIGVIPSMISSIIYPPLPWIPFDEIPEPIMPKMAPKWVFWTHRIFADPLTKVIGIILVIIILAVLIAREVNRK